MIKKFIIAISLFITSIIGISYTVPSFEENGGKTIWYNISNYVNKSNTLEDNLRNLFFPNTWRNGGIIWEKLRIIAVWLLFIFLVWAGALFLMDADNEWELKKAKLNILYILYWAFLVFASVWLLWSVLNIWQEWTTANTAVIATQKNIIWTLLIFFKSAAYYIAILMMVYYWFIIVKAQEKEDKIKAARTGALNIILALIAIKVLDYVYYIAQKSSFKHDAGQFIVWAWKILWWVLGVMLVLAVLYASSLLITSRWSEEDWKKAKIIIRNVFLVVFVLFLFIVIIYDLIKNFAV